MHTYLIEWLCSCSSPTKDSPDFSEHRAMSVCNCKGLCMHTSNRFQNTCQDEMWQKLWQAAWPQLFLSLITVLLPPTTWEPKRGISKSTQRQAHKTKVAISSSSKEHEVFAWFQQSQHVLNVEPFCGSKSSSTNWQRSPWASTSRFGVIWRAWWPTLMP